MVVGGCCGKGPDWRLHGSVGKIAGGKRKTKWKRVRGHVENEMVPRVRGREGKEFDDGDTFIESLRIPSSGF